MKKLRNNRSGFTLAELLIVVAIVIVLVTIAVPMFGAQRERANIAVDQATMRNAYAQFIANHLTGEVNANQTYYYDAASQSFVYTTPAGYGKSKTDAGSWWTGVGTASGIPNRNGKRPSALRLEMDDDGSVTFHWGSGAYTGLNVTSGDEYKDLYDNGGTSTEYQFGANRTFHTALVERDKVLLDSLQDEFQSMTYGQIKTMVSGVNLEKGTMDSTVCFIIAIGEIKKDSGTDSYSVDPAKNVIYLPEVFENAGYDTSVENKYIINSIPGTDAAKIWVNIRLTNSQWNSLKEGSELWNTRAECAYTYIKAAQNGDTAGVLREVVRRTSKP